MRRFFLLMGLVILLVVWFLAATGDGYDSDDVHGMTSWLVLDAVEDQFPPNFDDKGGRYRVQAAVADSNEVHALVDRLSVKAEILGALSFGNIIPVLEGPIRRDASEWVRRNREQLYKKYK